MGLFVDITDRSQAANLSGLNLGVPLETLPEPNSGEYYWHQLIGLPVVNEDKVMLGNVTKLMPTGANDVLVVRSETGERLIPFVASTVDSVNLDDSILVRWSEDWD